MEAKEFKMPIVDIHSHIIYGVDDGAVDIKMSLELIDDLYNQGVRDIFCTTHSYYIEGGRENYDKRFNEINNIVKEKYSDLRLFKGCEILCYEHNIKSIIRKIDDKIFPTLNETKYVLVEFDIYSKDKINLFGMAYCLKQLIDRGYIPIIAHAERYYEVYEDMIENIMSFKRMGCMVQVNLYSILGIVEKYDKPANELLNNKLIDFVGTDIHRFNPIDTRNAVDKIINQIGRTQAANILFVNASMYLINDSDK